MAIAAALRATLGFAALLTQIGCFAATSVVQANDGRRYSLVDSGAVAYGDHVVGTLHWISDNEILFVRLLKSSARANDESDEKFEFRVSVWNIATQTIRDDQDFGAQRPRVCFNDGHLLISVRTKDDQLSILYGKHGRLAAGDPNRGYSSVLCRPLDLLPKRPNWMEGRTLAWLEKANEGFVDFGDLQKAFEDMPIRLYRPGVPKEKGVVLPLTSRRTKHRFPYYPFNDAFFVASDFYRHPRPKEEPYPVYWLHRDGSVEKIIDIPYGPWRSSASSWPFPTKAGIGLVSHNFNPSDSRDLDYAGLYLFGPRRTARLMKAWIEDTAVSPNGCKVAFTSSPVVTQKGSALNVIDLCEGN